MKKFLFVLGFLLIVNNISASANTSSIIGGDTLVTPVFNNKDIMFCLYNEGDVDYMIYMTQYCGNESYRTGYIATVRPNQMIMLPNNASYRIYASYNTYREFTEVETVKKRFNQWWLIIFVGLIIFIVIIKILKVIT